jgi:hypothetical protein
MPACLVKISLRSFPAFCLGFLMHSACAQPITGVWKGKMGASRVELKLVRKGDSLTGTSYYYDSKNHYRRYSVKGYFDDRSMDVVWWDEALLEDHGRRFIGAGDALLAVADFNCPGEGIMKLDGTAALRDNDQKPKKELHLLKDPDEPFFPDEWDFVLNNYAYSVANPAVIDSIEQIALHTVSVPEEAPVAAATRSSLPAPESNGVSAPEAKVMLPGQVTPVARQASPVETPAMPVAEQTNEQRFVSRTKILQTVIPVKGDSIELRFYDNAEIDGDSIAVFLNGRLLREHILLSDQAYRFTIPVSGLEPDNELVMVAENLGSIPPNTSLMVAIVGDKRYEAHLQSTEGSSALVRLVKP